MATAKDNLIAARDNLSQIVADQTLLWIADGCPPSFSVDGESEDWNSWLKSKTDAINDLIDLIQKLGSPFVVRSKGVR